MLNEEEELRVNLYIALMEESKSDNSKYPRFGAYEIEWLCSKLKEVNEELKLVSKERDTLQLQYVSPQGARTSIEELTKP